MGKKLTTYGEVKAELQEAFYPETLVDDIYFIIEPTPTSKYPACIAIGAKVQHADTVEELIKDIEEFYSMDDQLQSPIIDIFEERREFYPGEIVKHFKAEHNTPEENQQLKYYYEIIGRGVHTETKEEVMVYKALYGDKGIYTRPYEMFMSRVDKEKYPDIKQKYRLEIASSEALKVRYGYKVRITVNDLIEALNKIKDKEQAVVVSDDPDSYYYLQSAYELTDNHYDDNNNVVALIGDPDTPSEYYNPNKII